MPAVSVLVPCYNVEKYIRQCLDSIVNQTLKDMEIICLNDGSTDGTLAILREYAARDSRIRIIDKPNSGYGDSMNKGLDAAEGDYIGIVESDDIILPNMFADMLALAREHNADMVKSAHEEYWSDPERYRVCPVPERFADRLVTPQEVGDLTQFKIAIWSGLYRRAMLEQYEIRFTTTPGASYQDTAFNFKVWVSSDRIWITSKYYYLYRQDNINSSMKNKKKIFAIVHEFRNIDEFLKKWNIKDKWCQSKDKMKFKCYGWNYNRINFSGRKLFLPVMKHDFQEIMCHNNTILSDKEKKKILQISYHPFFYLLKTQIRDLIKLIIK